MTSDEVDRVLGVLNAQRFSLFQQRAKLLDDRIEYIAEHLQVLRARAEAADDVYRHEQIRPTRNR